MITIESGRDSIIIWISECTGPIAQYFIRDLGVIIILVFCAVTGIYIYRKKNDETSLTLLYSGFV